MRKWKNGDRVRIIDNQAGSANEIGDIGIVSQIHEYTRISDSGNTGHLTVTVKGKKASWGTESYFEDVEYIPVTINSKIKVL